MHHTDNPTELISEARRLLKLGGKLIIVEHNIETEDQHLIVDLQHTIFSIIYDEPPVSPGNYTDEKSLRQILSNVGGFKILKSIHFDDAYDFQYILPALAI